ncbi:MAG: NADH-quinone oxidoreductase subunit L [Planctomycetaceae bacterium]|nr:NADH-quinone oxidoreductase subunit L [Planctomycetaceae bacterium]MCB9938872.1 NADH-quinone oxidoreductase subunit L [Planctomycetaceae bacterium]HRX78254.1 NADH-quinone oxidoreductase subunit L [Pirellulaceae bacterium]
MDDSLSKLLILIPAFPLAAAIIIAITGPKLLKQWSHVPVIVALVASFICSLGLLNEVRRRSASVDREHSGLVHAGFEHVVNLWTWADIHEAYELPGVSYGNSEISILDQGTRDFRIDITLRADALTAIMLSMVTFISTLVAIFGAGYMHGDRGYWRFFAYIGLFVFSMTMLVSVSNFILLFVFWEAVGVCSYLLIGFWYEKPEAAAAGKKAFLVNRVGDFGFALALFLIWTTYGTLNYHDTRADGETDPVLVAQAMETQLAGDAPGDNDSLVVRGVVGRWRVAANDYATGGVALAICLLLLLGACGKSAQFPLHVWLPDAMEGPTPVSALIHAATMVTAGVYMVTRCTPLFMASPEAQLTVACVGAFTALLAGLIAMTQYDLKRVLAYSTVSQLGYMFLALGTGTVVGISAGMFHLFTHAFFKALLFLGAGSVMHAMGNVIDMRRFGGLRKLMPTTHATFMIGCLALAGFPLLSGFFSKDSIVAAVHDRVHTIEHELDHRDSHEMHGATVDSGHAQHEAAEEGKAGSPLASWDHDQLHRFAVVYQWLYYSAMFTAFLTAFYTFRAFYMTFYGKEVIPHEAGHHAHESPPMMAWPLMVLAVCAALAGFSLDRTIIEGPNSFGTFLLQTPSLADGAAAATFEPFKFHKNVAGTSGAIAIVAILLATYMYLGHQREIEWIRRLMDFEQFGKWFDVESVSRWKEVAWVKQLHTAAQSVRLGWLTAGIGNVILLLALIAATPFMLGHFVSPYKLSLGKFFIDEIYQLLIVLPLRGFAVVCYAIDRWIVDGFVNLVGRIPLLAGGLMRSLQMGLVQFYALAMVLGVLVLLVARAVLAAG